MITLQKSGNGYNRQVAELVCLNIDTKPLNSTGGLGDNKQIDNGSTIFEMDTGDVYMFDYENDQWIMI